MNKLNQNRKILITGASGFLGKELTDMLKEKYDVFGCSRGEKNSKMFFADLANEEDIKILQENIDPSIILHAAGLKDLKRCEEDPELAYLTNTKLIENLCRNFKKSKIIYISTDYVFGGNKGMYEESDIPNPSTVYGKSKLLGEEIGFQVCPDNFKVIRTASIFSKNSSFIRFLDKMIATDSKFDAYCDCIFSPTSINHLVNAIEKMINNDYKEKIFHVAGMPISRYEFAKIYYEINKGNIKNISKSENKNNIYLFKNLSLSTNKTDKILDCKSKDLNESLLKICKF